MNNLEEKGLRRLSKELGLSDGTIKFLGVIANLNNHPNISRITNPSTVCGMVNPLFSLYIAQLKEDTSKKGLLTILNEVSEGQEFHVNSAQAGIQPAYLAVYKTGKIHFYQPLLQK